MPHTDTYAIFSDLAANEKRGVDYDFEFEESGRDSRVVVMAPHGGGIEPYTDEFAAEIAGDELVFYTFRGLKSQRNYELLHITSTNFNEPQAVRLAERAEIVLAVHGKSGDGEFAMVGGRHPKLVRQVETLLTELEIETRDPPPSAAARSRKNICNHCKQGGVQLELSMAFRERLRSDLDLRGRFVQGLRPLLKRAVSESD